MFSSGFTTEVSVWLPLPGDDNVDIVYVGTEVWATPTARCSPPCVLVLPNSTLTSATTIVPGNYTTSFEYGSAGTTTTNGQVVVTFYTTITTVVINVPPVTISSGGGLQYSNVNVTGQSTSGFMASPSVNLPPVLVPLPDGNGSTTERTATLPPWPQITQGPPDGNEQAIPNSYITPGGTLTFYTDVSSTVTVAGPTVLTVSFPVSAPSPVGPCDSDGIDVTFSIPRATVPSICPTPTQATALFTCRQSRTFTLLAASTVTVTQRCSLVQVVPTLPAVALDSTTSTPSKTSSDTTTTTTPLPVWTTWPGGIIEPVTTSVNKPQPTDGGVIVPCNLWFFDVRFSRPPNFLANIITYDLTHLVVLSDLGWRSLLWMAVVLTTGHLSAVRIVHVCSSLSLFFLQILFNHYWHDVD